MNTNGLPIYVVISEPYWDPSMGQIPFVQQPPVAYYQTNEPQYSLVLMAPPTPVSRTYADRSTGFLPPVPLAPGFQDPNLAYTSLGFVPQTTLPAPIAQPIIPASFPQPTFAAPFPQQFIPQPVPPPVLSPMHVPPRPKHRQQHNSPSVYHYHERHSLPPISGRERHSERDQKRHSTSDDHIMSYFGRRRDVSHPRYPDKWYH